MLRHRAYSQPFEAIWRTRAKASQRPRVMQTGAAMPAPLPLSSATAVPASLALSIMVPVADTGWKDPTTMPAAARGHDPRPAAMISVAMSMMV
jgi:hypothetical protein